jgi:alanine racemase
MSKQVTPHWRRATIKINLEALSHNLNKVREHAPRCQVMPVIKANAYGHGMLAVAVQLSDADMFAVAMPEEAFALREAGCDKPILVLHGFSNVSELKKISSLNISTVVHQQEQLQTLLQHDIPNPIDCWIKVDTGMNRLGIAAEDVDAYFGQLRNSAQVKDVIIMSHFLNADDPDNSINNKQIKRLLNVTNDIDVACSMANSAAIMRLPKSHFEIVRPGIMLYGSSPFHDVTATELGLKAVMQFESLLIDVKTVREGESIGYGATFICDKTMPVGVVAAGYGDGYSRHAKNGTPVWINGVCCKLLGRVSMDSLCVDLSDVKAQRGDRVVLWGEELSVDRVARSCDTISYELLCNAGAAYLANQ